MTEKLYFGIYEDGEKITFETCAEKEDVKHYLTFKDGSNQMLEMKRMGNPIEADGACDEMIKRLAELKPEMEREDIEHIVDSLMAQFAENLLMQINENNGNENNGFDD